MTRPFPSAVLLCAVLMAGCASLPAPGPVLGSEAPALPATWSIAWPTTGADDWRDFADPLLVQLVDEALQANLDLRSARASLERARALRDVAEAGRSLQVGSSGSAGRNRSEGRGANTLRAGLDASWEADVSGAIGAGIAAATASAEASAAALQATRLQVAAETALAYVSWQGLRQQIDVAGRSLASQEETRQLVEARVRAGLGSTLDLAQADANLEQTRARLPALRHSATQAEHALSILLGQPPAALAQRLAAAPRALPQPPALPAEAVPADVLQRRPDLQAAERSAAAALATLQQREAERRPSFTISGNLALQAASLSALGGSGTLVAGLATAVHWTVLDGGAGRAQVAAQQASLEAARIGWHAAVLSALQDVEDSLSALASSREREATLERADAAAAEALDLARLRWRAGTADQLVLLDAERTALAAADSLAGARTDLASAHIRLLKALGGGLGQATRSDPAVAEQPS